MRIIKFISLFLLTAIIIFGFVIGFNWNTFKVFIDNREALMEGNEWILKTVSLKGLSEFIGENPEHGSISSVVISKPDSSLHFGSELRRSMGTTSNLFILLGYAIEMENGRFTNETPISWQDISKYQLPDVNESEHHNSYRIAERRGWIKDSNIFLNDALHLLAETNDLALADYLWWQLSPDIWDRIPDQLNLIHTDMPLPFSGLYLSISPYFQETSMTGLIHNWNNEDPEIWRQFVIQNSDHFANDSEYRDEVLGYMEKNRLGNTFMGERDAMILFPSTTTEEITRLMKDLVQLHVFNENVSNRVLEYLRWPMRVQSGIEQDFLDYGALYDNRMGLMTGIDFGTSGYTGDTTVQALFMDRLPIGFWFHASGGHMHQDFMQRLIYDPAFIDQLYHVTEN